MKINKEHLKKAEELHNKLVELLSVKEEVRLIAQALADAEEKGWNNAFTEIVYRKGKIKNNIITFKVPLTEIKKSWEKELK
jgi:hypothetical protein